MSISINNIPVCKSSHKGHKSSKHFKEESIEISSYSYDNQIPLSNSFTTQIPSHDHYFVKPYEKYFENLIISVLKTLK